MCARVSVAWRTLGQNAKWALIERSFETKKTIICGHVYSAHNLYCRGTKISDRISCILYHIFIVESI
jgi:hypothetical protein